MNKHTVINRASNWFTFAAGITMICGIIYITVQQAYRQSANDPQFQLAQDAANALNNGADPKTVVSSLPGIEISQSLSPFLVIYANNGSIAASNATLDGNAPKLPQGVLDNAKYNGMTAVSWQPRPGLRHATVSLHAKGYIVVAGRSLRITEERIEVLGQQVVFGWAMSLIGMAVILFLQGVLVRKPELGASI